MDNVKIAKELVKIAKGLTGARKVKYKGYTIEESGDNFYVKDSSGHRAFGEVPASIATAKKWIDQEVRSKRGKVSKELTAGEDKKAEWSKRFEQLTYWTSGNTSTSVDCGSLSKAKKIINFADVDQELISV